MGPDPFVSQRCAAVTHTFTDLIYLFILEPCLWHMEVPRLGVKSEGQLLAYTTASATPDPSHVCDLHHGSWQCWILNPLSEARDQTCIFKYTSQICFPKWFNIRASSKDTLCVKGNKNVPGVRDHNPEAQESSGYSDICSHF